MIDILVPVRERPDNVIPLIASIKANTVVPHRIMFLVQKDDQEEIAALFKAGALYMRTPEHGYAHKINWGCKLSTAEFIFLGADDLAFHPDWDSAAIDLYYATEKPVIGTNDIGNPTVMRGKHATHSLVHRSYLEQGSIDDPTKLLHEGYGHQWVDTEFVATARKRNAWVFCKESVVEHLHPFWHKGQMDPIYALGQSSNHADVTLFNQRRRLWR